MRLTIEGRDDQSEGIEYVRGDCRADIRIDLFLVQALLIVFRSR